MSQDHSFSQSDLYQLKGPIDFARGYYARAFRAYSWRRDRDVAFKVLRPEHLSPGSSGREYLAFGVETRLLHHFAENAGVVNLLDCGFISDRRELPRSGEIVNFDTDVEAFGARLQEFRERNWRPYLCEELMPEDDSLFVSLRENAPGRPRRRLPTEEGIALSWQYTELLQQAHADDIVYLDAKPEHFYWNGEKLCIIDWNSSRMLCAADDPQDDPDHLKREDIRNFVVGVMYVIFTGLSAQGHAVQESPSHRDAIAQRYQVRTLDFGMEPSLPQSLIDLMQSATRGEYQDIKQFKQDLEECAQECGWPPRSQRYRVTPPMRAREEMRKGLAALRQAQQKIQEARESFMEIEGDPEVAGSPLEVEAKRLTALTNTFLKHRVIP